jgi:hypothetical protein
MRGPEMQYKNVGGRHQSLGKQILGDQLDPFKEQSGKILPGNLEKNFNGFLVRKDAITFKVDTQKLNACIALLKEQLLIA